ncbi:hypothetical protein [Vitiosangium sp. GDMCC 1.1324]|uniref:hypothetical protein n=1 Tax=Vitiosangium sp. (strain GDMCC 1.1324) TaxID=2138576 RepID=UPI000D36541E|nr:hypothetical protein [Vitiosangium sp. GDMCC 1.1324]PTL75653.1 hypothetical protein DAT35_53505 [Vitiosangium sp. GDMCC 1.1324]
MKLTLRNVYLSMMAAGSLAAGAAGAYPISPSKVPVNIIQDPKINSTFALAYDHANSNIVYYAPKGGRTATMNGMPLIGFALLGNGEGLLNAQMEYGVFGSNKTALFNAITAAGKTPVQWPFRKTKIVPMTPGINPETGEEFCETFEDPVTGETVEECSGKIYREIEYSQKGPTLGENIAMTGLLSKNGAMVTQVMLRQGNALQLNVEAEYLEAGTAFTATVTVKYQKLFQNFHAYAGAKGFLWKAELETFWRREGLCVGRPPTDCGIWVEYKDQFGNVVTTPTIDPDNAAQQTQVYQAVERFVQSISEQMLAPMSPNLDPVKTGTPSYGFRLDAKFESQQKSVNFTRQFTSPNGVNVAYTAFPVSVGCVLLSTAGDISRNLNGDCALYWQ